MKKYLSLVIAVVLFTGCILLAGCGSSKADSDQGMKKLIECLDLTKNVDSMEANLISKAKEGGQSADFNMNMKIENIQKDWKCFVTMDMSGKKQEFYLGTANGKADLYMKDESGKYAVQSVDSSQIGDMDMTRSFNVYIEIIQKNPEYVNKVDENTYQLKIPKEKISETYSQITGKSSSVDFETMSIDFVIGSDKYLKSIRVRAESGSADVDLVTDYLNYNKKFNIILPTAE